MSLYEYAVKATTIYRQGAASPHPSPLRGEGAEGEAAPTRLFYDGSLIRIRYAEKLCDVLISSEYCCETIAKSLDTIEYHLGGQICGANVTSIQFLPGERRGYRGMRSAGTQGVGGRCVATYAVLSRVNRDAPSQVRRALSDGDQIWIGGSELLPHRFDPAAYALEGIPNC